MTLLNEFDYEFRGNNTCIIQDRTALIEKKKALYFDNKNKNSSLIMVNSIPAQDFNQTC